MMTFCLVHLHDIQSHSLGSNDFLCNIDLEFYYFNLAEMYYFDKIVTIIV